MTGIQIHSPNTHVLTRHEITQTIFFPVKSCRSNTMQLHRNMEKGEFHPVIKVKRRMFNLSTPVDYTSRMSRDVRWQAAKHSSSKSQDMLIVLVKFSPRLLCPRATLFSILSVPRRSGNPLVKIRLRVFEGKRSMDLPLCEDIDSRDPFAYCNLRSISPNCQSGMFRVPE